MSCVFPLPLRRGQSFVPTKISASSETAMHVLWESPYADGGGAAGRGGSGDVHLGRDRCDSRADAAGLGVSRVTYR